MNRYLAVPVLATILFLQGCALAGGALNTAGNILQRSNWGVAQDVGGFYKGLAKAVNPPVGVTPAASSEEEPTKKK